MLRHLSLAVLAVSTLSLCGPSQISAADKRPNIVFILADDIGIDGIGCYGSDRCKELTPNIDQLAGSGLRFERCFATPLCGPSRCLLMTGRYGFRTGGMSNKSAQNASYQAEPSLARILKQAGYATGMAGKWRQMNDSPGDWGFDEYITDPTASGYYWKTSYTKNGKEVTFDKDVYYPDQASDFAVDFMRRHRDEPFYFYLPEHLIHGPILRTPDSNSDANGRQLYDDNVKYLDKTVGKIVAELDKLGLRERTLIVFSADNGTSKVGYTDKHDPDKTSGKIGGRAMWGMKGSLTEGGIARCTDRQLAGNDAEWPHDGRSGRFQRCPPHVCRRCRRDATEGCNIRWTRIRPAVTRRIRNSPTMDLRATWQQVVRA